MPRGIPEDKSNVPEKYCKTCGKRLELKIINGSIETLKKFNKRMFCDTTCSSVASKKEVPEKYCKTCGKRLERKQCLDGLERIVKFNKRLFCDNVCSGIAKRNDPEKLTWAGAHAAASRKVSPGPCAYCGKPNGEIHHIDHNEQNNSLDNLVRICIPCHSSHHKKMDVCVVCGKPHSARGFCKVHYSRFMRHGDPNIVIKPLTKKEQSTQLPMALGD